MESPQSRLPTVRKRKHAVQYPGRRSQGPTRTSKTSADTDGPDDPGPVDIKFWLRQVLSSPPVKLLIGLLDWAFSVILLALYFTKPFFAVGLILYFASYLVSYMLASFSSTLRPICGLPIVSLVPICQHVNSYSTALTRAELRQTTTSSVDSLINVHTSFTKILEDARNVENIPLQMALSEISVTNMKHFIEYRTQLPSKDELVKELDEFVGTTRIAVDGLIGYSARLGSAVDMIVYSNDDTLKLLERAKQERSEKYTAENEKRSRRGSSGYLSSLVPFRRQTSYSDRDIITQFVKQADVTEQYLAKLIAEGTSLIQVFDSSRQTWNRFGELIASDTGSLELDRDHLLANLWSRLGGRNLERRMLERNIASAKVLEDAWRQGSEDVGAMVVNLKGVQAQVKEVRASLTPGLVGIDGYLGDRGEMMDATELEKQVRRIESSVEELRARREAAKRRVLDSARNAGKIDGEEKVLPVIGSGSKADLV